MAETGPQRGFAQDPMIPSRDVLLDPKFVAEQIGRFTQHHGSIESCTLRRARYRVGETLRVVYDVVADGAEFVMSARTSPDSATLFRETEAASVPVIGMPGVAHDPQTNTVWCTVPNDLKMRNLGTLLEPPVRVRQSSGVAWDQSQLVEYDPERSATARLLNVHGEVTGYAKAYRDRDALEVANQYNRVAASIALLDGIRTPRAVGWARPDRIVVLEPLRGRAWTQLPIEVQPNSMRHFGAALAKIHSLPTDVCPGPFQRYRVERVAHSADLVATARPDVADAIHELGDKLADGPGASGATVNIYGDLHTNNVLFHGNEVHMIDFDQGGSGAASADIGSLLASLMTTQLISPDVPADGLGAAFLDGYGAVRKLPSNTELKWYTTAAFLVEGAIRAVNRVDRPALAVLPEMLDIAEAVYDGKLSVDA